MCRRPPQAQPSIRQASARSRSTASRRSWNLASASSAAYKDASSDRRRSTPMAKPGRNDRCPCGSGKKYKACCLTRDEAAEQERLAAQQAEREERAADAITTNFAASLDDGEDDLEETVSAALRFIHEGKLEQIETAARHLMERYPDIPDGWEFLGHVHEKRSENREAVACYRRVLEIINRTPDDFDPEYTQRFEDRIAKLDQPQAT